MVAIIDDREDIWGGAQNLIRVKPYVFFPGVTDINAPPSNSNASALVSSVASTSVVPESAHRKGLDNFLETDDSDSSRTSDYSKSSKKHDNKSSINRVASGIQDPDNFLLGLGNTLSKIHKMFYAEYDANYAGHQSGDTQSYINTPDLKEIICTLKSSVLQDCCICFTGIIPTNIPPETCPEWKAAKTFGATIHATLVENSVDQVCKPTTHLIVGKAGTSKLHKARTMPSIKIVDCRWLWASVESWQHADEALYPPKESEWLHKEEKHPSQKNETTSDAGQKGSSDINVSLLTDKENVEIDYNNSDGSTSVAGQDTKDDALKISEGSRKRKLSDSSYNSDEVNSDDDQLGALLLESYIS